jgi:hypothetical protein
MRQFQQLNSQVSILRMLRFLVWKPKLANHLVKHFLKHVLHSACYGSTECHAGIRETVAEEQECKTVSRGFCCLILKYWLQ